MKYYLLIVFTLSFILRVNAQEGSGKADEKMNIVKTNITAYAFRNFNLSYERSFNQWFSLNIGFGTMPEGKVPFINTFLDDKAQDQFKNLEVKTAHFTIEPRFYIGRGYGKGFYFAPYYRYSHIKSNSFDFYYNYQPVNGITYQIPLIGRGDAHGNSGGLMVGTQFFLNKAENLVLDFWIAGAHYGTGKGDFSLTSNITLTPEMQAQLKKEIEDLDVPYVKYSVETNAQGARIKVDGPWAGFRTGLSLGYRF